MSKEPLSPSSTLCPQGSPGSAFRCKGQKVPRSLRLQGFSIRVLWEFHHFGETRAGIPAPALQEVTQPPGLTWACLSGGKDTQAVLQIISLSQHFSCSCSLLIILFSFHFPSFIHRKKNIITLISQLQNNKTTMKHWKT